LDLRCAVRLAVVRGSVELDNPQHKGINGFEVFGLSAGWKTVVVEKFLGAKKETEMRAREKKTSKLKFKLLKHLDFEKVLVHLQPQKIWAKTHCQ
jgi:hypothetical protein